MEGSRELNFVGIQFQTNKFDFLNYAILRKPRMAVPAIIFLMTF